MSHEFAYPDQDINVALPYASQTLSVGDAGGYSLVDFQGAGDSLNVPGPTGNFSEIRFVCTRNSFPDTGGSPLPVGKAVIDLLGDGSVRHVITEGQELVLVGTFNLVALGIVTDSGITVNYVAKT